MKYVQAYEVETEFNFWAPTMNNYFKFFLNYPSLYIIKQVEVETSLIQQQQLNHFSMNDIDVWIEHGLK